MTVSSRRIVQASLAFLRLALSQLSRLFLLPALLLFIFSSSRVCFYASPDFFSELLQYWYPVLNHKIVFFVRSQPLLFVFQFVLSCRRCRLQLALSLCSVDVTRRSQPPIPASVRCREIRISLLEMAEKRFSAGCCIYRLQSHERVVPCTRRKSPHRLGGRGSHGPAHVRTSRCQGVQSHRLFAHYRQS